MRRVTSDKKPFGVAAKALGQTLNLGLQRLVKVADT